MVEFLPRELAHGEHYTGGHRGRRNMSVEACVEHQEERKQCECVKKIFCKNISSTFFEVEIWRGSVPLIQEIEAIEPERGKGGTELAWKPLLRMPKIRVHHVKHYVFLELLEVEYFVVEHIVLRRSDDGDAELREAGKERYKTLEGCSVECVEFGVQEGEVGGNWQQTHLGDEVFGTATAEEFRRGKVRKGGGKEWEILIMTGVFSEKGENDGGPSQRGLISTKWRGFRTGSEISAGLLIYANEEEWGCRQWFRPMTEDEGLPLVLGGDRGGAKGTKGRLRPPRNEY
ncbi:hypothetical protein C8R43DRAFT_947810 [Mycena crocata]|nr:hypothetical protein C8R43DRAFT_947810 [Mycena crocata]